MVREVKSRALRILASNVEELFEVFFCLREFKVRFEVGGGAIEAVHVDPLDFVDVDTAGEFCNKGSRGDRD